MTKQKPKSTKRKPLAAPALGPRLKALRLENKQTLDQLAKKTNISKSMLSQIERGETNPTFAIIWTLTQALSIDLSELVGGVPVRPGKQAMELLPAHYTPAITSKDGLCVLRILSPIEMASQTEWYDVHVAPAGILQSAPHSLGTTEHFTCTKGQFLIKSGTNEQHIKEGDTVRYAADVPHSIVNDGDLDARGLLLVQT